MALGCRSVISRHATEALTQLGAAVLIEHSGGERPMLAEYSDVTRLSDAKVGLMRP